MGFPSEKQLKAVRAKLEKAEPSRLLPKHASKAGCSILRNAFTSTSKFGLPSGMSWKAESRSTGVNFQTVEPDGRAYARAPKLS